MQAAFFSWLDCLKIKAISHSSLSQCCRFIFLKNKYVFKAVGWLGLTVWVGAPCPAGGPRLPLLPSRPHFSALSWCPFCQYTECLKHFFVLMASIAPEPSSSETTIHLSFQTRLKRHLCLDFLHSLGQANCHSLVPWKHRTFHHWSILRRVLRASVCL